MYLLINRKCNFMKTFKTTSVILFLLSLCLVSCLKEKNDTLVFPSSGLDSPIMGGEASMGNSSTYHQFTQGGYTVTVPINSIPLTTSGEDGHVGFSVEKTSVLPQPLPSCLTAVGDAVKIEPFNFTFQYPIMVYFPITNTFDPQTMGIYTFNEYTNLWEKVPISGFTNDKAIINTLTLGYFVIAKNTCTPEDLGGIRFIHPSGGGESYFYSLTIISCTTSNNGSGYSIAGKTARTIPLGDGKPNSVTYIPFIAKGTYNILISRERRNSISSEAISQEYFTENKIVYVTSTLTAQGNGLSDMGKYIGWTDVSIGSPGSWVKGRPSIWGTPTATYGNGKFQATLTWVNNNSSACDYDLHLYGPNSLHVFFDNERGGGFELDRDWMEGNGNAIENIYCVNSSIPRGSYTVKVNLYGGRVSKDFNCRILHEGKVVKSTRSSISSVGQTVEIYSFNIN